MLLWFFTWNFININNFSSSRSRTWSWRFNIIIIIIIVTWICIRVRIFSKKWNFYYMFTRINSYILCLLINWFIFIKIHFCWLFFFSWTIFRTFKSFEFREFLFNYNIFVYLIESQYLFSLEIEVSLNFFGIYFISEFLLVLLFYYFLIFWKIF